MNTSLREEVIQRLLHDYGFKNISHDFLQKGQCPNCGKKELYTSIENPWILRCGRLNKCGSEYHIKELYPELFSSWSDRHKVTPHQPHAAADAYLRDGRGFDITQLNGWYSQGSYYCPERQLGTATVKFLLPNGSTWERFIDKPERFGKMKACFSGKYKGYWWQAPTSEAHEYSELWLTEGIFDAIALLQAGIPAVSLMSCHNYPEHSLQQIKTACLAAKKPLPKLIFAFDEGVAGESFTRKFVRYAKQDGFKASAAQPPSGKTKLDWNELFQRGRLTQNHLADYRYLGRLLIAKSPLEKAKLMHRKTERREFPFRFDNRLFWFKVDYDRLTKALNQLNTGDNADALSEQIRDEALNEAAIVNEVAACYPEALYYQAHEVTDESWYYFRVSFPHDGTPIKNTFTGGQLSSASEFKKRLMSVAPGAVWTGSSGQLDQLMKQQLYDIKRVQGIDYVGYSKEHKLYILGDIAVKDGLSKNLNDEDFFDFGKLNIKTLNKSVSLTINHDLKQLDNSWQQHLYDAFQEKGLVTLAFWFGTLFAEQIRLLDKTYPFLEVVGEPGSGKSTLIEFLWRLCGRADEEGFDPVKSTAAARARRLSQVANLPVVLIEGDRGDTKDAKQRGFDWDELKTAYNGRSPRSRGVKNAGNETYEPPFRGTIVISQNADVQASQAVLERIIHIHTDRKGHTPTTRAAARALELMPIEHVSGWILKVVMQERAIMARYQSKTELYEAQLSQHNDLKTVRIIKNHAQLMALIDCLELVTAYNPQQLTAAKNKVTALAIERQQAVSADHPLVQQFWEVFDYLEGKFEYPVVNHSKDQKLIAVNLNHLEEEASEHRQQLPPLTELKKHLKLCKSKKFIDIKTVSSAVNQRLNSLATMQTRRPASVKCWVFEKE